MSDHSSPFLRATAIVLSISCVLVVLVARTRAQNPPVASQTAAPTEKTVEQVHTNIQVLKGLPASQLNPVMNYMPIRMRR